MHPPLSRLVAEQSIVIPMIDTLSQLLQPTSSSSEDQHISLACNPSVRIQVNFQALRMAQ